MSPSRPKQNHPKHRKRQSAAKEPLFENNNETKTYSFEDPTIMDTSEQGRNAFSWLVQPMSISSFFTDHFEKKPFLRRSSNNRFADLLSLESLKSLVCSKKLFYNKHVDVTSYNPSTGRETLNPSKMSLVGSEAWNHYNLGCSLRLLRPQAHIDSIYRLCYYLESFLECVVGANVYLTPPSSQGFAPHFDDIDAFVCQVSGRKRWRVYAPRDDGLDTLPRFSSIDLPREDVDSREVILDTTLGPGDLLYLPRGFVHEAICGKEHSLHVTISTCQKWTWADLLLASAEAAIRSAATNDEQLRQSLPLRFGHVAGVGASYSNTKQRNIIHKSAQEALKKVASTFPTDAAADLMMTCFMRERLPPPIEKEVSKVSLDSRVRLVAAGVARIVLDLDGETENIPRLLHCIDNSREGGIVTPGAEGINCLPVEALAIDKIIGSYPKDMEVRDLPLEEDDDKLELVRGLVDMGVVKMIHKKKS